MNTCSACQFALNMLRCTFVVLQLYCLLVACGCLFVRGNAYRDASTSIDCREDGMSRNCGPREQEIRSTSDRTELEAKIHGGFVDGDGGVEEVTSRKKKNKGYWTLLLYFLGAGKLTMLYVVVNTVAAIAAKALIVAKVALALATAIGLKKLLDDRNKVSFEIVRHPLYTYEQTHSSSIDYEPNNGVGESNWYLRRISQ